MLVIGNGELSSNVLSYKGEVIRINHGIKEGPCTIWVHALKRPDLLLNKKEYKHCWNFDFLSRDCLLNKEYRNKVKDLYNFKSNPSTGLMLLYYLINDRNTKDIITDGFEGSTNRISGDTNFDVHDWDRERKIYNSWVSDKLIRRL